MICWIPAGGLTNAISVCYHNGQTPGQGRTPCSFFCLFSRVNGSEG